MTQAEKARAALKILFAVTETIREAKIVPSGTLYASLMAYGCTIQQYESIIATVTKTGLVEKNGSLLVWKGPVNA